MRGRGQYEWDCTVGIPTRYQVELYHGTSLGSFCSFALKVSELKDELAVLGEPTTGLKGELVERLEQAMRARE